MGIQTNLGGKTITVDRVDEIFGSEQYTSPTLSVLKSAIADSKIKRDLDGIRAELDDATSDGKITPNEKSGLKREWYALLSSWSSVDSTFSNSDYLKNNSSYLLLKDVIKNLTAIMDKVFADMNSTYEEDDVSEITENILNAWTLIDNCNTLVIENGALQEKHKLEVAGNFNITDRITLNAKLYLYKNGAYQDVTADTAYKDSEFKWYDPKYSDNFLANGRECIVSLSNLKGESRHQFVLEFEHTYNDETTGNKDVKVKLQSFFDVYYGTITQYAYSDDSTIEELKKETALQWSSAVSENENGKAYLWRRETSELNKEESARTWNYFRETGLKGETGKDGENGENGWSQATIQLFRRSETIPTEKPLALNYAFRTGALSSGVVGKTLLECLNGWSQTVVAGTSPLYVIYASAFNNTETDPIDPNDWTPAAVLSENGTKGENGYTVANVVLYKRFATQPATPSETITYNFYIGTIQGNLDGWSKDFPADDGNPLWVTNATASTRITGVEISTDDKDTITPSEWSTPQIMAKNGAKGDKGDKTYVHIAYANSADGATDFSLTESLDKKYLGQCTDTNATAPKEPSAYKWTKIEGASGKDGQDGANGEQGYSIVSSITRDGNTDSWWNLIGSTGHEESWAGTEDLRNGCRIGDMFTVVGTSTEGKAHIATYRSTTDSGVLAGKCISHIYSEKGAPGAPGEDGDSIFISIQYYLSPLSTLTEAELSKVQDSEWKYSLNWEYGYYIYKREKTFNSTKQTATYSYLGRDNDLEQSYKDRLSFSITADRTTYNVNYRGNSLVNTNIGIRVNDSFYKPSSIVWTSNGVAVTPTIQNGAYIFAISETTEIPSYAIKAVPKKTIGDTVVSIPDTVYGYVAVTAINKTEYMMFHGAVSTLENVANPLLDNDSCFLVSDWVKDGTTYLGNRIYVYTNGSWVDFNNAVISNDKKGTILAKAQKTALEMAESNGLSTDYGFFNTLIAKYVSAYQLGANEIILTGQDGIFHSEGYTNPKVV